jgi:hypothetical protein
LFRGRYSGVGPILILLAIPLIPVDITLAIVRHPLLDIRLAVSRALTTAAVGVYIALVAVFDLPLRRKPGWGPGSPRRSSWRSPSTRSGYACNGLSTE